MKWFRIGIMLLIVVSTIVGGQAYAQIAPSVKLLSPRVAEVVLGSEVTVVMEAAGTTITRPDGSKDAAKTHFQLFLDINPPAGTGPVPVQAPYVHTTATSYTFKDLKPGEHTLILQLAYGDHSPVQPALQQTIKFTTREAKKIGLFGTILAVTAAPAPGAQIVTLAVTAAPEQAAQKIKVTEGYSTGAPAQAAQITTAATLNIQVGPGTEVKAPGKKDASLRDVTAGKRLTILANTADGVYSAIKIMVIPDEPENKHIVGAITAISATTITVVEPTGKIIIIDRTPGTKFLLRAAPTGDYPLIGGELKVGDFVTVVGHLDKDSGVGKAAPVALPIIALILSITVHPPTVQAEQNAINEIQNLQYILARAPDQARPGLENALQKMKESLEEVIKAVGGNVDKVKKDWSGIEGKGRSAISSIDKRAKTVTISLPSGENLTIKIVASTKIERDGKEATGDSLAVGDRIEKVSYDAATLEARKLEVEPAQPSKAVGKDLDNLKIRLEEMAIQQQDVFDEFERSNIRAIGITLQPVDLKAGYEAALTAVGANVGRVKQAWDNKEKEKAQEREKATGKKPGETEKQQPTPTPVFAPAPTPAPTSETEKAKQAPTPTPTPAQKQAPTPTPTPETEKVKQAPTPSPTHDETEKAKQAPTPTPTPAQRPAP